MLPEAVRLLHLLVSSGKRVYVHCTAGINRATLTTVGYLTFVKVGWQPFYQHGWLHAGAVLHNTDARDTFNTECVGTWVLLISHATQVQFLSAHLAHGSSTAARYSIAVKYVYR